MLLKMLFFHVATIATEFDFQPPLPEKNWLLAAEILYQLADQAKCWVWGSY
jgi:hypothetical protein